MYMPPILFYSLLFLLFLVMFMLCFKNARCYYSSEDYAEVFGFVVLGIVAFSFMTIIARALYAGAGG